MTDDMAARLEANKYATSSTPDADRPQCHECGSVNLRPIHHNDHHGPHHEHSEDYQCRQCETYTDGVEVRDP